LQDIIKLIFEFIQTNTDTVIALGTLFVSFVSIILAIFALVSQRRHDRAAVRPVLQLTFGDYESDIMVKISNVGLGPTRIKKVTITDASRNKFSSLVKALPPLMFSSPWTDFCGDLSAQWISAQGEKTLIRFTGDPTETDFCSNRDYLRKNLAPLSVVVIYEDFFGKKFTTKRSLEWFQR